MEEIIGMIGVGILAMIAIALILLYITNVFRIVIAFKEQKYTILLGSRIIGVFVPIWGVVMGCVK